MTIIRSILLFALMSLASYSGLGQEYYPLAIGNRWDYREVYTLNDVDRKALKELVQASFKRMKQSNHP
jgi:hypothetical protein